MKDYSTKRFVEMYEKAIGENPSLEQQLLLKYFKDNERDLPVDYGDPASFHKAFRQIDVCRKGYQDMVIWSLLSGNACDKIWNVLEEYYAC